MNDVLQAAWAKSEPTIAERVGLVHDAVQEMIAGRLRERERLRAVRAAHNLAGSLGLFGLHRAGEAAHALERQLELGGRAGPGRARLLREELDELAVALRPSPPA